MTIATIILDCAVLDELNVGTIDKIARLQLAARTCGVDLQFDNANRSLLELIDFCGLAGLLGVEPERQSE